MMCFDCVSVYFLKTYATTDTLHRALKKFILE